MANDPITNSNQAPPVDASLAGAPDAPQMAAQAAQLNQPQSSANSNAPDADTAAGASVPIAAVNNPTVPSQKMATIADLNKTSPAPHHSWIAQAAEQLAGGPKFTTTYDENGNAVRTKVPVSPRMIGFAIALEALRGGLSGAGAKGPNAVGQAAELGLQQGQKDQAAKQQAQQVEDARTSNDQRIKQATMEGNLRVLGTAIQLGRFDKENHDAAIDTYKDYLSDIKDNNPSLVNDNNGRHFTETEAKDTKQFPASEWQRIPVGTVPRVDEKGDQVYADMDGKIVPAGTKGAHALWDNVYDLVHMTGDARTTVLDDNGQPKANIQRAVDLHLIDPKILQVGTQPVPLIGISKATHQLAMLDATQAEADGFVKMLNGNKKPSDKGYVQPINLEAAVKGDPSLINAFQALQRSAGSSKLIWNQLNNMAADPKAAQYVGVLRRLFGNDNLQKAQDAYETQRAAEKTAADTAARLAIENSPENQAAKRNLKRAELQDTRDIQDEDIDKAARNIISNPADTTAIKSIASMRGDERLRLYNKIHELNPNYDTGKVDAKVKVLNDFADGKAADNIVAYNTFLGHALDASEAVNQFRGTGGNVSPLINKGLNWLDKNAANDPTYAAFKTALIPVQKEFMSFLNNNRAEHEADIEDMKTVIDPASTPAQIQATLKKLAQSGDIRLTQLGRKYQNTMGVPYENLYSPEGKAAVMRLTIPKGMTRIQQPSGAYVDVPSANAAAVVKQYPQLKVIGQEQ